MLDTIHFQYKVAHCCTILTLNSTVISYNFQCCTSTKFQKNESHGTLSFQRPFLRGFSFRLDNFRKYFILKTAGLVVI